MERLLVQLGLTPKQIQVFMQLLDTGPSSPSALARLCNLPRPTVYAILEELCDQGFVQEDLMSTKKIFLSTPPEDLIGILEPMRSEVDKKEILLKELIPILKSATQGTLSYTPRIVYIPQGRIESYLRSQTPKWNASLITTGTEYVGFQDRTCTMVLQDWIRWYWQQPSSKDIKLRLISNSSDFEENTMTPQFPQSKRHVLPWEGAGDMTFSTWINGDYTLLINTRQRPFYLIEIFDPSYAQSQRQIFEAVWKTATDTQK